jgi:hypothetical protein
MSKEFDREKYYIELKQDFLKRGSPELAEALTTIIRIRDRIQDEGILLPYYPYGSKRFIKLIRPEEDGNPFGGLLFPMSLSDGDRVEIIEYFGKNPDIIPWESLGSCTEIIRACKATGMEVPQEVISSRCGDSSCPHCGCS